MIQAPDDDKTVILPMNLKMMNNHKKTCNLIQMEKSKISNIISYSEKKSSLKVSQSSEMVTNMKR